MTKKMYKYKVCIANSLIRELLFNPKMDLSIYEYRILLFLIAQLRFESEELETASIWVKDFLNLFNVEKNGCSYRAFKEAISSLIGKPYIIDGDVFYWLDEESGAKNKSGQLLLRLNEDVEPYVLNLKREYTSFEFGTISNFKSKYAFRVYLFFRTLKNTGFYQCTLPKACQLFCANKYSNWNGLNYNVLKVAIDEINDQADIYISYELRKNPFSDDVVCFVIRDNKEPCDSYLWDFYDDSNVFDDDIKDVLQSLDIVEYLKDYHDDLIIYDSYKSRYTHPLHDSVCFYDSYFIRFSTRQSGDLYDYLTKLCHLDQSNVIKELQEYCKYGDKTRHPKKTVSSKIKKFNPPEIDRYYERWIIDYLFERGITKEVIQSLIDEGLLYSDEKKNCVFYRNDSLTKVAFIRGTYSKKFRRTESSGDYTGFWYFSRGVNPNTVYICEAPIDAISLFELNGHRDGIYAALGGVNAHVCDVAIARLNPEKNKEIIFAVDNDSAGRQFRFKYKDYPYLTWNEANGKDINELLQNGCDEIYKVEKGVTSPYIELSGFYDLPSDTNDDDDDIWDDGELPF